MMVRPLLVAQLGYFTVHNIQCRKMMTVYLECTVVPLDHRKVRDWVSAIIQFTQQFVALIHHMNDAE